MKRKEIYTLVASLLLIAVFVWWRSTVDVVSSVVETVKQEVTQATKSSSSGNKPSTSVAPKVDANQPVPVKVTSQNLAGTIFRLTTFRGQAVPADTKFILSFTDSSLSFKVCNTLNTNYFIDGTMLKGENVTSTLMACTYPSNIMAIESDAASLLSTGATIYRTGNTLILSSSKNGAVLVFEGF